MVEEHISIPAHTRLQVALRYMAQGPMYLPNRDIYGVSKASMSIHIYKVFATNSCKVNYYMNIYLVDKSFLETNCT